MKRLKNSLMRLKQWTMICCLLVGGCGLVSGALAYGAMVSGKVLYVSVAVSLEPAPLTESQLAAVALRGEMGE